MSLLKLYNTKNKKRNENLKKILKRFKIIIKYF